MIRSFRVLIAIAEFFFLSVLFVVVIVVCNFFANPHDDLCCNIIIFFDCLAQHENGLKEFLKSNYANTSIYICLSVLQMLRVYALLVSFGRY